MKRENDVGASQKGLVSLSSNAVHAVIQHPRMFNDFATYCKHLKEVLHLQNLPLLVENFLQNRQIERRPELVCAYISYHFQLDFDAIEQPSGNRCFVFDLWSQVIRFWPHLTAPFRPMLWLRFEEIVKVYYNDTTHPTHQKAQHFLWLHNFSETATSSLYPFTSTVPTMARSSHNQKTIAPWAGYDKKITMHREIDNFLNQAKENNETPKLIDNTELKQEESDEGDGSSDSGSVTTYNMSDEEDPVSSYSYSESESPESSPPTTP